jgi:F-type H+-transporting ATPase subunit epsilon
MQFDLVSPERRLAQAKVTAVQIPGADGDMTAMADHAPTITTLRPGVLMAEGPDGSTEYLVTGGFAEIGAEGVTVLAERAMPTSEVTQEHMDELVREAEESLRKVKDTFQNEPGPVDDAAKLLSDMVAVGTHMGLTAR